jgi:hypothetical protein
MAYADQAQKYGKQAVQIVELYLDFCENVYGVAPCTASLGTTGTQKCFNTCATCQDRANLNVSPRPYRFSTVRVDGIQQLGDPPTFPTLLSVKTAPTVLQPGKGLGIRSSLGITIADHPWTDVGIDPYQGTRGYDADGKGTFWGKFITRNRYYENRRIDVLTGFLSDDGTYDAANFKRRTYIITKISGPDPKGVVSLEAKDPLRLADGEKAKWPQATQATLATAVTSTTTTIDIDDPELSVTTWWNAGQRYIRCEDEIMLASAIAGLGTDSPSLTVDRGNMPARYDFSQNVPYAHDVGASMQPCHFFDDAPVYDIVYYLLHDVAGIDAAYLPVAEWQANIEDEGFQYLHFTCLLTEPVDVKTLLDELSQHTVLIWWDERSSEVQLKGLRFRQLIGAQFNDDNAIIAESTAVTEDTASLLTQNWLYFDLQWPLANMTLLRSYRVVDVRANLQKETAEEYAKPAIRTTRSRWLSRADAGVAMEIGFTMLKQYQDVRKAVSWTMDPKDDTFWVGDTVGLASKYVQDFYGDPLPKNVLITQVEEDFRNGGYHLKYVGMELFAFLRVGAISHPDWSGSDPIPAPANYDVASPLEKNTWAYICYDDRGDGQPGFLDGTSPYQII